MTLVGKEINVYVDYRARAGGTSFIGRLTHVESMDLKSEPVLLHMDPEALVSLDPARMQPFRVVSPLTGQQWLEFDIAGDHVVSIDEVDRELD